MIGTIVEAGQIYMQFRFLLFLRSASHVSFI